MSIFSLLSRISVKIMFLLILASSCVVLSGTQLEAMETSGIRNAGIYDYRDSGNNFIYNDNTTYYKQLSVMGISTQNNNRVGRLDIIIVSALSFIIFYILFKFLFKIGVTILVLTVGYLLYDIIRYDTDYSNMHLKIIPIIAGVFVFWFNYRGVNWQG